MYLPKNLALFRVAQLKKYTEFDSTISYDCMISWLPMAPDQGELFKSDNRIESTFKRNLKNWAKMTV